MIEVEDRTPPPLAPSIKIAHGLMCRHHRTTGFKIALVVGATASGKLRVRFWRANSACWTGINSVDEDTLTNLTEADYKARAAVIKRAADAAIRLGFAPRVWS